VVSLLGAEFWREERRKWRIAGTPRAHIGQLRDGQPVSIRGIVRGLGRPVVAAITGRTGVFVKYWLQAEFPVAEPHVLKEGIELRSFEIVEDGKAVVVEASCIVDFWSQPEHLAKVHARRLTTEQKRVLDAANVENPWPVDIITDFVFAEAVVADGDEVQILGRAAIEIHPQGDRESLRDQPIRRALHGTKAEPVVLMRVSDASELGSTIR
jgi:hypothetical protein